jgi:hypothetical protein
MISPSPHTADKAKTASVLITCTTLSGGAAWTARCAAESPIPGPQNPHFLGRIRLPALAQTSVALPRFTVGRGRSPRRASPGRTPRLSETGAPDRS